MGYNGDDNKKTIWIHGDSYGNRGKAIGLKPEVYPLVIEHNSGPMDDELVLIGKPSTNWQLFSSKLLNYRRVNRKIIKLNGVHRDLSSFRLLISL